MKAVWIGALALGLMPMTAMAGGHSTFGISVGFGSSSRGNHWSVGFSTGRDYGHRYSSVRYYSAPVYVAPAPVYVQPRVIQPSVPVYVPPLSSCTTPQVYIQPQPVYVPPPVVVAPAPVYVAPPVYGPVVHFDYTYSNWSGGRHASPRYDSRHDNHGRYDRGGGSRYSYRR